MQDVYELRLDLRMIETIDIALVELSKIIDNNESRDTAIVNSLDDKQVKALQCDIERLNEKLKECVKNV